MIKRDMVAELDDGPKKEEQQRDNDGQPFFLSWQTLLRVGLFPSPPSGRACGEEHSDLEFSMLCFLVSFTQPNTLKPLFQLFNDPGPKNAL